MVAKNTETQFASEIDALRFLMSKYISERDSALSVYNNSEDYIVQDTMLERVLKINKKIDKIVSIQYINENKYYVEKTEGE